MDYPSPCIKFKSEANPHSWKRYGDYYPSKAERDRSMKCLLQSNDIIEDWIMNMKDLGLVPSVAQCVKDAEGTAEIIKEQIPRLRSRVKKRQSERSPEFFEAVVLWFSLTFWNKFKHESHRWLCPALHMYRFQAQNLEILPDFWGLIISLLRNCRKGRLYMISPLRRI